MAKPPKERYFEVDLLKTVGIGVIVLIHSMRPFFDPGRTEIEAWLGGVTEFAVPGFLFVSGFLYASTEAVPWRRTLGRLRRILVPYLLASLAAQLYLATQGGTPTTGSVVRDLLYASSFGPYYYVFAITLLVLAVPFLPRLGRAGLPAVVAGGILLQGALIAHGPFFDFFWEIRNPLRWGGYFLLGWWTRLRYVAICAWLLPRQPWAVPVLGLASLLLAVAQLWEPVADRVPVQPLLGWLRIYSLVGLVFTLGCGRSSPPRWLRFTSDATYAVYLFHLFAIYGLRPYVPFSAGKLDLLPILAPWTAGLLLPMALVVLVQRVLGRRSRAWLGA